jgi:hypothetical protein
VSIYKIHLQKIEQGRPSIEVTFTMTTASHATEPPTTHTPGVSCYSLTIKREHCPDAAQVCERDITVSEGIALARLL